MRTGTFALPFCDHFRPVSDFIVSFRRISGALVGTVLLLITVVCFVARRRKRREREELQRRRELDANADLEAVIAETSTGIAQPHEVSSRLQRSIPVDSGVAVNDMDGSDKAKLPLPDGEANTRPQASSKRDEETHSSPAVDPVERYAPFVSEGPSNHVFVLILR